MIYGKREILFCFFPLIINSFYPPLTAAKHIIQHVPHLSGTMCKGPLIVASIKRACLNFVYSNIKKTEKIRGQIISSKIMSEYFLSWPHTDQKKTMGGIYGANGKRATVSQDSSH
jgi:hypothetical protein